MEKTERKTVLVSGAGGFIGTILCKRLVEEKFKVTGLAMPGEKTDHLEQMGVAIVRGDLTMPETIHGLKTTIVYPSWVKTKLLDSPEFGTASVGKLPGMLAEDPVKVVRESIRGIRREQLHVRPGLFAKLVWHASKAWPIVSRQSH